MMPAWMTRLPGLSNPAEPARGRTPSIAERKAAAEVHSYPDPIGDEPAVSGGIHGAMIGQAAIHYATALDSPTFSGPFSRGRLAALVVELRALAELPSFLPAERVALADHARRLERLHADVTRRHTRERRNASR